MRDFDEIIDRRGTGCAKWDEMESGYGVSPGDGLAMWVADMDFRPPEGVDAALRKLVDHGIYGYPDSAPDYLEAIRWWMQNRHGWQIAREDILSVHGLVNGTALAIDAFTRPGDAVVMMAPIYHAFYRIIRANGREVTELPLKVQDGRHVMDWEAWEARMTGREKLLILCSPHNPGGRVWTEDELRQTADFARRHDLILVSDEIHHDLVFPGSPRHTITALAMPEIADRLITLTSSTKTFNIAGAHLGNAIITDPALRQRVERVTTISPHPTLEPSFYAMSDPSYAVDPGRRHIGYFGNFYATRGMGSVLDALEVLPQEHRDRLCLDIFASNPDELLAQVEQRGLGDVVRALPGGDAGAVGAGGDARARGGRGAGV